MVKIITYYLINIMIAGSIVGLVAGVLQDIICHIRDKKNKHMELKEWRMKMDYEFELDKKRSDFGLKDRSLEFEICKEGTLQEIAKADVQNAKNESTWYNAVSKATGFIDKHGFLASIANFITATTRPIISYLFLVFIAYIYTTQISKEPDWLESFTETVLLQMEFITSFWFYRRGSDRITTSTYDKRNPKY